MSSYRERKTKALSGLRHKDGTPLNEKEKMQMKWLQKEVKRKLGIGRKTRMVSCEATGLWTTKQRRHLTVAKC